MPGTTITVAARSGPGTSVSADESCLYLAGLTERGPVDSYVELRSWADFVKLCGDPQSYSWAAHAARTFFEDRGAIIRLIRLAGPAAALGSHQLVDRAAVPQPTLRIDAANPGAWSSRLSVEVRDGLLANTFDLFVRLDGTVVDTFRGLATPAAAEAATAGSVYIRAVDLASPTAAPNNNPAVAAATDLAAGDDDRGTLVPADFVAALDAAFPPEVGTGVVAIPGFSSAQIGDGLLAHCQSTGRNAYVVPPQGTSDVDAKAAAAALLGAGGEFLEFVWPWVTYTDDAGVQHTVPPEGFAAAGRSKAIAQEGVWRAAAGAITRSSFLDGVETVVTAAAGDDLDDAHVTVIRMIQGRPEVYGARSLSTDDDNWALFKTRDLVNKIVADVKLLTGDIEFGTIDQQGRFLANLAGRLKAYLQPLADAGALFPKVDPVTQEEIDPGWSIDVSDAVNTVDLMRAHKAGANVTIRPSESATDIVIQLTKAALTASV